MQRLSQPPQRQRTYGKVSNQDDPKMHSTSSSPTSGLIPFPKKSRYRVAIAPKALTHTVEIHELCRDTSLALQELRHGALNVLLSTLETLDMDTMTLVQILDER